MRARSASTSTRWAPWTRSARSAAWRSRWRRWASSASCARRCPSGGASSRPPTAACRCPRRRRSSCCAARRWCRVELGVELVTPTGAALVAALGRRLRRRCRAMTLRVRRLRRRDAASCPTGRTSCACWWASRRARAGDGRRRVLAHRGQPRRPAAASSRPTRRRACFAAGALDVWTSPAQMKKRPARASCSPPWRGRPRSGRWPRPCCARRPRSACGSRAWSGSSSSARSRTVEVGRRAACA